MSLLAFSVPQRKSIANYVERQRIKSEIQYLNRFVWNFSTLFDLNEPLIKLIHASQETRDD